MIRYAILYTPDSDAVAEYLPSNYSVLWSGPVTTEARYLFESPSLVATVISGTDSCGWTLDDYVLPRLASGLYFGQEIDLSHPIMKVIPDAPLTPRQILGQDPA